MADATQLVLTMSVPTLAVLMGILVNNSRLGDVRTDLARQISDLRFEMNTRFDAQSALFTEKLYRVEQVLDARLRHLEENR